MNTGKPIQTIPTTSPEPIPPTQPPTAPLLHWVVLITALLIQLRQTLEASTELLDQLEELTDSCTEMLKTIVRIFRRK